MDLLAHADLLAMMGRSSVGFRESCIQAA